MAAAVNWAGTTKLPGGVGMAEAEANPDWFLTDTTGKRIEWCDYAGDWQMDVGKASYQDRWAANVGADSARTAGTASRRRHQRKPVLAPLRPHDREVPDRRRVRLGDAQLPRQRRACADLAPGSSSSRTSISRTARTRSPTLDATGSRSPPAACRSSGRSGARATPATSPATTGRTASSSWRAPSAPARSSSASPCADRRRSLDAVRALDVPARLGRRPERAPARVRGAGSTRPQPTG